MPILYFGASQRKPADVMVTEGQVPSQGNRPSFLSGRDFQRDSIGVPFEKAYSSREHTTVSGDFKSAGLTVRIGEGQGIGQRIVDGAGGRTETTADRVLPRKS